MIVRVCIAVLLLSFCVKDTAAQSDPHVRVRVLGSQKPTSVSVKATGGDLRIHLPSTSSPVMRLRPGESATLSLRGPEVAIERSADGIYASALDIQPDEGVTWTLTSGDVTRAYTGPLHVEPDGSSLQLVNHAPLDDYVASVVAAEYGFKDLEGSKAMAVVARTYGVRASDKFNSGDYDHVDNTVSQVYRGVRAITPTSRRATQATAGQVLTYDGSLIEAVYFSSSGGHTANNEDVWDAKDVLPYLRGKRDPYDRNSPHHRWSTSVPSSQLLSALSNEFGTRITGFVLGKRSSEGRLKTVTLLTPGGRMTVRANNFRLAITRRLPDADLKSTWFDASRNGNTYRFSGRGFGHGVGLSQWGIHEMSDQGRDYQDMLSFYYSGVDIRSFDGAQIDAPARPVASNPPKERKKEEKEEETTRRIGW
ncbi:SpoIID/LytB domain-containing protein [Longibacter salinarum]|nr:SpoIID/LytB domain-containing protein [Longibacter salinarum]